MPITGNKLKYSKTIKAQVYNKAYKKSDKYKAYLQKPEIKKHNKEYFRLYAKKYRQLPKVKAYAKKRMAKYNQTEKGKMIMAEIHLKRKHNCEIIEHVYKALLIFSHQGRCVYCGKDIKNDSTTHIDHMIPVSRYIKIEKKFPYKYSNIVPTCALCNLKKHDKTPLEFLWNNGEALCLS